jgi:hypothetical protein
MSDYREIANPGMVVKEYDFDNGPEARGHGYAFSMGGKSVVAVCYDGGLWTAVVHNGPVLYRGRDAMKVQMAMAGYFEK